ncbi:hypothetical protein IFM89_017334 [Coptis chinensis]|uniref:Uncharacterized protein n=1 Tax=Coptis chinensis TaxID=261450 RepID=A0A835LIC4_9MAGN|nr:hypothetical protein IFM89_017334 [Coptis chinensis]
MMLLWVFDTENFVCLGLFTFPWSVNNTSVSPDEKLLAVLGDNVNCLIADAHSGKVSTSAFGTALPPIGSSNFQSKTLQLRGTILPLPHTTLIEYIPVRTSIRVCSEDVTFDELHGILLSEEITITDRQRITKSRLLKLFRPDSRAGVQETNDQRVGRYLTGLKKSIRDDS